MKILWQESAWEEYLYWQLQDTKTLKRINIIDGYSSKWLSMHRKTGATEGRPQWLLECSY